MRVTGESSLFALSTSCPLKALTVSTLIEIGTCRTSPIDSVSVAGAISAFACVPLASCKLAVNVIT